jgi:hypothetical protein
LNTVLFNNISGSGISSNQFYLPSGQYYIDVSVEFTDSHNSQMMVKNVTDSVNYHGRMVHADDNNYASSQSESRFYINISSTKYFQAFRAAQSWGYNGHFNLSPSPTGNKYGLLVTCLKL